VVEDKRTPAAGLVAELGEQPVVSAVRRRLAHRDPGVAEVRPRDVDGATVGDDVRGLRLIEVDLLNQPVAAGSDVADVDRAAAIHLTLIPDVPLLGAGRLE